MNRKNVLSTFESAFDKIFNDAFPDLGKTFGVSTFKNQAYPRVDIVDYHNRVELDAAIPGWNKTDISVEYANSILTISGEKKPDSEVDTTASYIVRELKRSSFSRSFSVDSTTFDTSDIKAVFKDGLLKLTLKKIVEDKTPENKKIAIE